jgi:hypothetical protein
MTDMRRVVLEVLLGPAEGWEVAPGWAGLGQELQPGRQLGRGHLHVCSAVAPMAQRRERVGTVPRQELGYVILENLDMLNICVF